MGRAKAAGSKKEENVTVRKKPLKTIENEAGDWGKIQELVPHVKKASRDFPSASSKALIQESSRELLNSARNHVKTALESKIFDPFAIDVIRSIAPFSKQEPLLKLLFHILSIEGVKPKHLLNAAEAMSYIIRDKNEKSDYLFPVRKDLDISWKELTTIVTRGISICISCFKHGSAHNIYILENRFEQVKNLEENFKQWVLECEGNSLSNCTAIFHALWKEASSFSEDECFFIRQRAVAALLIYGEYKEIVKTSTFKNACTCATKAFMIYSQSNKPSRKKIDEFLRVIGSYLDSICMPCYPYVEFCTYRRLQSEVQIVSSCEDSQCLLPTGYAHNNCTDCYHGVSASLLMFLATAKKALSCRYFFDLQEFDVQTLLHRVETVLLTESPSISTGDRLEILKLVSKLNISQVIYKFMSEREDISTNDGSVTLLSMLSRVQCDGIGPMAMLFLRDKDALKDDRSKMAELYVESMVRGIWAAELCVNAKDCMLGRDLVNQWVESIEKDVPHLVKVGSHQLSERLSKALSLLGRDRRKRELDASLCAVPILASLRLKVSVGKYAVPESFSSLQYPVAWSTLASIYRSSDRPSAASLAQAISLFWSVVELSEAINEAAYGIDDLILDFLRWTATKAGHFVSFGKLSMDSPILEVEKASAIIRRIVDDSFSITPDKKEASLKRLRQKDVLDLIADTSDDVSLRNRFAGATGTPLTVDSLVHLILMGSFDPVEEKLSPPILHIIKVTVIVKISMLYISKMRVESPENRSQYIPTLRLLYSLAEKQAQKLESVVENLSLCSAVTTMVSLVFCLPFIHPEISPGSYPSLTPGEIDASVDTLIFASRSVRDATYCYGFDGAEKTCDGLLPVALLPSCTFLAHFMEYSLIRGERIPFQILSDMVDSFLDACRRIPSVSSTDEVQAARVCLAFHAARLSELLLYHGGMLESTKIATMGSDMVFSCDDDVRKWFEAQRTSVFLETGIVSLAEIDFLSIDSIEAPIDLEYFSSHLRLLIRNFSDTPPHTFSAANEVVLRGADDVVDTAEKILWNWGAASANLLHSEFCELKGGLHSSIEFIHRCIEMSKKALLEKRRKPENSVRCDEFFVEGTGLSLWKIKKRIVEGYKEISLLYSRLGDFRRTKKYLSLAQELRDDQEVGNLKQQLIMLPHEEFVENMEDALSDLIARSSEENFNDIFRFITSSSRLILLSSDEFLYNRRELFNNLLSMQKSQPLRRMVATEFSVTRLSDEVTLSSEFEFSMKLSHVLAQAVSPSCDTSLGSSDVQTLEEASDHPSLNNVERARSLYLLACNSLSSQDGESSFENIGGAIDFLSRASVLLGEDSSDLHRKILRLLATVRTCNGEDNDALRHTSKSIGMGLRAFARETLRDQIPSSEEENTDYSGAEENADLTALEILEILRIWEDRGELSNVVFQIFERYIPAHWTITLMCLSPTGSLLSSSITTSNGTSFRSVSIGSSMYEKIISPLDGIIEESQKGLQSADPAVINKDRKSKSDWWCAREILDEKLEEHLRSIEEILCDEDGPLAHRASGVSRSNLEARFNAASNDNEFVNGDDGELRDDSPTILILDENLCRIPFEGMDIFREKVVCRMPSLFHLIAALVDRSKMSTHRIDPKTVSYILDPDQSLPSTHDRLLPFLEDYNVSFGSQWEHVAREAPSPGFILKSVSRVHGMMLFFGHGGGQQYISRSRVASLVKRSPSEAEEVQRNGRAAIFLMGCSSGRLESINRKGVAPGLQIPMHFEPDGIAMWYLTVGSPCVIGNLWDVTDLDIDRFSMKCLKDFWSGTGGSLAECVSKARSECKLPYIVGCAPVCYGIPVYLRNEN